MQVEKAGDVSKTPVSSLGPVPGHTDDAEANQFVRCVQFRSSISGFQLSARAVGVQSVLGPFRLY